MPITLTLNITLLILKNFLIQSGGGRGKRDMPPINMSMFPQFMYMQKSMDMSMLFTVARSERVCLLSQLDYIKDERARRAQSLDLPT